MAEDGGEVSTRRIQVRLVTKLDEPYKVPTAAIAIPADLTRLGLSSIVNALLRNKDADHNPEPFDFLIDGEFVRMSLEQFLLAKGISTERTLEIEYTRVVAPRKEEDPSLHDDWVSAVDGSSSRFFLTGCYDGLGRVWKGAGLCSHILEGHSDAVSSVCIVNPEGEQTVTIATASKDRTLRLWKVCSGSWDCTINVWKTSDINAEDDLVSKKRKVEGQVKDSQLEGEAYTTLVGHTQCVSSVVWPQRESIYSASWDHSIRKWDVETGKNLSDIFSGKVLNCLDVGGEGSALIAAGGSDPVIRVWDPRKPGTSGPVFQFASHTSWVSSCKWHDNSWFHLLSASYDGKVMLWDLRTAWPLSVIESHSDKVLCADWWKGDSVISGGADSKLCISSEIPVQ
ncbi:ribosome biogenesis protein WDR12 homolog isoform X2 [Lotus japonicus]|uniref:ribosome biogenesis protein WDR12 homolog isoform X2 n=1 Tax=Lotus japonicus TaxID=34305 RepID=UPI002582F471|nr:ribosome biogenesis protein WDR12 homolog isoform X2 [Lotus japonicus]